MDIHQALIQLSHQIYQYYLQDHDELESAKKTGIDLYNILHENISKNNEKLSEEEIGKYCEETLKHCFRIQSLN